MFILDERKGGRPPTVCDNDNNNYIYVKYEKFLHGTKIAPASTIFGFFFFFLNVLWVCLMWKYYWIYYNVC